VRAREILFLSIFPYLITLCVVVSCFHPAWLLLLFLKKGVLLCLDGRAFTDPYVRSLNVVVPLGFSIHLLAIVLSVFKYKENQLYVISRFAIFVFIVYLTVTFGNHLFDLWLGERFPLKSLVWWLF